jgi:ferredoxin-NADP reductase
LFNVFNLLIMSTHIVKVLSVNKVTHDVVHVVVDRPEGYGFVPGQATNVALKKSGWEKESRPFTFTSKPDDDHLEFVIKMYPDHNGMTHELRNLQSGDALVIDDPWGSIQYNGKGLFIAGGAGITPFISIFKTLHASGELAGNRLLFGNKTQRDIILEGELSHWLGDDFVNVLSEEEVDTMAHGFIDEKLIRENLTGSKVYVCGPPPMMDAVGDALKQLKIGNSDIVTEVF